MSKIISFSILILFCYSNFSNSATITGTVYGSNKMPPAAPRRVGLWRPQASVIPGSKRIEEDPVFTTKTDDKGNYTFEENIGSGLYTIGSADYDDNFTHKNSQDISIKKSDKDKEIVVPDIDLSKKS